MKGLSILFTMALLVTAHLLSVQLRRARALPTPHPSHVHLAHNTSSNRPAHRPVPADPSL